ncbi:MAG: molybdopterin oxidoreductase family protein, partial [Chloroflexota bacterium]
AIVKTDSKYAKTPEESVATVCSHCGVGCGVYLDVSGGKVERARSRPATTVNGESLCVKGQFGYEYVASPDRLSTPSVRAAKGGDLVETSWEEALAATASQLSAIREKYGADAIGFVGSGRCSNEDNYLLQKVARAAVGTNNVSQVGESYLRPVLDVLGKALGVPAATNPLSDLEKAGCILVVGANPTEEQPIVGLRLKKAVRQGAKLITVSPRPIDLERFAHIRLRPRPGSEATVLAGLLRVIVEEDLWDRQFAESTTEGLAELLSSLDKVSLAEVSAETGLSVDDIKAAARLIATGGTHPSFKVPAAWFGSLVRPGAEPATERTAFVFGVKAGSPQIGPAAVQALVDLALVTGNVGAVGGGIFPLAMESNQQGASDMGALSDHLPGYQTVDDASARSSFDQAWGAELPRTKGLTFEQMLEAAADGKVKALYIMGANPLLAAPNPERTLKALANLELLVVQDAFATETAALADVVLPGATLVEKGGTVTSTERRVQALARAVEAPGQAQPDWQILAELGGRLAAGNAANGFAYGNAWDVLQEINRLVPIYGGIARHSLNDKGMFWPCPDADHPGTQVLLIGERDGAKARVEAVQRRRPMVQDRQYPVHLLTGSTLYHIGSGELTRRSARIAGYRPAAVLEVSTVDAERLGIQDGDVVKVVSRQGAVQVQARANPDMPAGVAFLPQFDPSAPANSLAAWASEGEAGQVEGCWVRLERP